MMLATLVLRDVHLPAEPAFWPPAPGWWIVAAGVLLLIAIPAGMAWARRRRLRRWAHWFDRELAGQSHTDEVATISALLRRAARRVNARADRLQGEAWLDFLDGAKDHTFSTGTGRLLLDGAFQREVDAEALARLRAVARARFLQLMAGRR